MKNIIKSFSYVLIMIVIATMVSGCSSKQQKTESSKKFVIWSFEDEDVWKPTVSIIQKQLSGYEVIYVKKRLTSTYENDALNSMLSGQGPDVWAIPNSWVYRHKDKLASMPEDLIKDLNLDSKYVGALKQSCYIDNALYSLSPLMDTLMVYYNQNIFTQTLTEFQDSHPVGSGLSTEQRAAVQKENSRIEGLLETPPSTWTEFAEATRLITKKSGTDINLSGVALGTSNNIQESVDIIYALMMQNGTKMTSEDLKLATFSLPEETSSSKENTPAKRAVDFFTSFSNPTSPNYSWNTQMPGDIEAFVQGKVAMIIAYGSLDSYLSQNYPSFKYKKSPLPQIGDNETNIVDYGKFQTFVVPKTSSNTLGAWNTIMQISSIDSEFASTVGISSSLAKSNFTPSLTQRDGVNDPGTMQAQTAKSWIKGRYPSEIDKIFKDIIDKSVSDPSNIQSHLDSAAVTATNLLKKSDW